MAKERYWILNYENDPCTNNVGIPENLVFEYTTNGDHTVESCAAECRAKYGVSFKFGKASGTSGGQCTCFNTTVCEPSGS